MCHYPLHLSAESTSGPGVIFIQQTEPCPDLVRGPCAYHTVVRSQDPVGVEQCPAAESSSCRIASCEEDLPWDEVSAVTVDQPVVYVVKGGGFVQAARGAVSEVCPGWRSDPAKSRGWALESLVC